MSWDSYGCAFLGYHSDGAAHGLQVFLRDTDLTGETVCLGSQKITAPQLVTPEADLCYVQSFVIIAVISLPAVGYHLPVLPRQRAADPPRQSFPQEPAPSRSRPPPAPLQSSWRWGRRWRLSGDSHIPKHSHVISHCCSLVVHSHCVFLVFIFANTLFCLMLPDMFPEVNVNQVEA